MSVIIKGMDMPKSCFLCGLKTRGMCPILIKRVCATDRKVDEDCPLEPADQILENQKTGRWIRKNDICTSRVQIYQYECSNCREINTFSSNYCPHCGAKMEGE